MIDLLDGAPALLRGAYVPRAVLAGDFAGPDAGEPGIVRVDIGLQGGTIAFVAPHGTGEGRDWRVVELDRALVLPCFAEAHAHVDSTQIWDRSPNRDGSFAGAGAAIVADRETFWTPQDMRRRMDFGLRCAWAHGVRALRTHLASQNEQIELRWDIFAELREAWAGRIAMQGVPLLSTEVLADPAWLARVVDLVRRHDGVLGAFAPAGPGLETALDGLFDAAARHGLSLDFHADENGDPGSTVLDRIAAHALARGGAGQAIGSITVGHCCSLALREADAVDRALDSVARAGIGVVSLPGCNLYLQGRAAGQTPRWRGVTLLHEMAARGIPVMVGTDNCRDPYNPFGDGDPLDSFRDAVRVAHLDNPVADWVSTVTTTPATLFGASQPIAAGAPADLVVLRGRGLGEVLSRPGTPRRILRGGRPVDAPLPDYSELES